MTREYKAVARHPGRGEAKNPGGPPCRPGLAGSPGRCRGRCGGYRPACG